MEYICGFFQQPRHRACLLLRVPVEKPNDAPMIEPTGKDQIAEIFVQGDEDAVFGYRNLQDMLVLRVTVEIHYGFHVVPKALE